MKDELVTFETAKLAKDKGFNKILCKFCFVKGHLLHKKLFVKNLHREGQDFYVAPTQSLLQRWLREEHNISVDITTDAFTNDTDNTYVYQCVVWEGVIDKEIMLSKVNLSHEFYEDTYEQALETGLFEALKLIKP